MGFDLSLDISNTWVVVWFIVLLSSIATVTWMKRKESRDRLEARIREFCRKWL